MGVAGFGKQNESQWTNGSNGLMVKVARDQKVIGSKPTTTKLLLLGSWAMASVNRFEKKFLQKI